MIAIELRFLANRFHATPWDRQVNEGAVEWPPAPWRLARALIATWYHKAHDEILEETMRTILSALAEPPAFHLPPAVVTHTRHYMPTKEKTTKVFDTFVRPMEEKPLVVVWQNAELAPDALLALKKLLERLGYLGRAESWVEATLVEKHEPLNARLIKEGDVLGPLEERVRLLAPLADEAYGYWRAGALEGQCARRLSVLQEREAAKGKGTRTEKLPKKDLALLEADLAKDVFTALHADVGDLRKAGWSQPPGSRWVAYARPTDAFATRLKRTANAKIATVARYAVSGSVLPKFTDALLVGEWARMGAMSCSKNQSGAEHADQVFSGKTIDGARLESQHAHAYYLPESHDDHGKITHITVYCRNAFSAGAQQALSNLQRLWDHDKNDLQLVLLGMGEPADFVPEPGKALDPARGHAPMLMKATTWVSVTPFVPTRHAGRGNRLNEFEEPKDGVEDQLRRELANHGHPNNPEIARLEGEEPWGRGWWLKFRRTRKQGGGTQSSSHGYAIKLTFKEPVQGPIVLGYGAHFGLGQFTPEVNNG